MTTVLDFGGGKYTVVHTNGVGLRALRYGEPWRDLAGDGLVLAMAQEVDSLRERLKRATAQQADTAAELDTIHRLAACGTTQNWLKLSDEDKAKWFGLCVSESSRRARAETQVEQQSALINQLEQAFQTIQHSMRQAQQPGNDGRRELALSLETANEALTLISAHPRPDVAVLAESPVL